jgi:hypothetical protein
MGGVDDGRPGANAGAGARLIIGQGGLVPRVTRAHTVIQGGSRNPAGLAPHKPQGWPILTLTLTVHTSKEASLRSKRAPAGRAVDCNQTTPF